MVTMMKMMTKHPFLQKTEGSLCIKQQDLLPAPEPKSSPFCSIFYKNHVPNMIIITLVVGICKHASSNMCVSSCCAQKSGCVKDICSLADRANLPIFSFSDQSMKKCVQDISTQNLWYLYIWSQNPIINYLPYDMRNVWWTCRVWPPSLLPEVFSAPSYESSQRQPEIVIPFTINHHD